LTPKPWQTPHPRFEDLNVDHKTEGFGDSNLAKRFKNRRIL